MMPAEFACTGFPQTPAKSPKRRNAAGYANVRAHAVFYRDYLLKQQRQAAMQAASTMQSRGVVRP
jgi:hypothetical protein